MPTPRESHDWKTETGTKFKHTQTTMANGSNEMVSGTTCKRFTPRIKIPNGPSEILHAINACKPVTLAKLKLQTIAQTLNIWRTATHNPSFKNHRTRIAQLPDLEPIKCARVDGTEIQTHPNSKCKCTQITFRPHATASATPSKCNSNARANAAPNATTSQ